MTEQQLLGEVMRAESRDDPGALDVLAEALSQHLGDEGMRMVAARLRELLERIAVEAF